MKTTKNSIWPTHCKHCGKPLGKKHGNREFCHPENIEEGEQDCKQAFNNFIAKITRDKIKNTLNLAVKNMKILEWFYNQGILKVSGDELLKKGFEYRNSSGNEKGTTPNSLVPIYFTFKLISIGNNEFKIEKI